MAIAKKFRSFHRLYLKCSTRKMSSGKKNGFESFFSKMGSDTQEFFQKTEKSFTTVSNEKNSEKSIDTVNEELRKMKTFLQEKLAKKKEEESRIKSIKSEEGKRSTDKKEDKEIRKNPGEFIWSIVALCRDIAVFKMRSLFSKLPTIDNPAKHFFRSFAITVFKLDRRYTFKFDDKSNIVSVLDKNYINRLENPWFARVDSPHSYFPFYHINVNPKITGVKDPHTHIAAMSANIAGHIGKLLEKLNRASTFLMTISVLIDLFLILSCAKKDYCRNSSRNTAKKLIEISSTILGAHAGCAAGASIGTVIFPGIGTIIGGLFGGIDGGVIAGISSDLASELLMDLFKYNIDFLICGKCHKNFENRRYKEGIQTECEHCRDLLANANC